MNEVHFQNGFRRHAADGKEGALPPKWRTDSNDYSIRSTD